MPKKKTRDSNKISVSELLAPNMKRMHNLLHTHSLRDSLLLNAKSVSRSELGAVKAEKEVKEKQLGIAMEHIEKMDREYDEAIALRNETIDNLEKESNKLLDEKTELILDNKKMKKEYKRLGFGKGYRKAVIDTSFYKLDVRKNAINEKGDLDEYAVDDRYPSQYYDNNSILKMMDDIRKNNKVFYTEKSKPPGLTSDNIGKFVENFDVSRKLRAMEKFNTPLDEVTDQQAMQIEAFPLSRRKASGNKGDFDWYASHALLTPPKSISQLTSVKHKYGFIFNLDDNVFHYK